MVKTKSLKRAMLMSLLALVVCLSMFVGSTFAWFTDSVTSVGNIIKSGKLDVTMEWADGKTDPTNTTWKDASTGAIFNSELWEPGYVEVRHIKIANAGTLALKYQLNILANGAVSELADVIDVYYFDPAKAVEDRDALANVEKIGTLSEVLAKVSTTAAGELKAGENHTITLALKMQETAGNEYQDKSIGSDFSVQLLATQLTSEEDAFDNQYDKGSAWDGTYPTTKPDSLVVDEENKLISINDAQAFAYLNTLVNDAWNYGSKWQYSIELNTDINLLGKAWTPIVMKNFVSFDGKGHTISNLYVSIDGNSAGLFGVVSDNDKGNTVVKNLNIDGAYVKGNKYVGTVVGSNTNGSLEKVTVNNATVIGVKYVGGIFGSGNGSVNDSTIKNSTVSIYDVVIDPEDNSIDSKEAGGLAGYISNDGKAHATNKVIANNVVENVTVTAPTIASGLVAQPNSSNSGGALIEIKNNAMKNVTIITTADASASLYVSNNVGGKSIVVDNTAVDCNTVVSVFDANDLADAISSGNKNIRIVGADFTNKLTLGSDVNATFVDCEFTGNNAWGYAKNVTFENCVFDSTEAAVHFDVLYGELVVKDCTFTAGKVQIGTNGSAVASFENCVFGETEQTSIWSEKGMRFYCPTKFTNCEFNNRVVLAGSNDLELTFDNCTMNDGTPVYYVDNTDGIIRGGNIPNVTIK